MSEINQYNLHKKLKDWEKNELSKVLDKYPERKKDFKTSWNSDVSRLGVTDASFDYENKLGFPGSYPYTRGVQPTMYRGRLWTMRQYAGFGNAKDTNKRFKYLLEKGLDGLSVAFDLPTQIGLDSDDETSTGEVGRIGVAVDTIEDMETIFQGIDLSKISTSMTINSTAMILLAMYIAVAKKQGVDIKDISGTVQNDILKEYVARGTYIFPIEPSMKLATDIFEYCSQNTPKFNFISVSGYHIREAGSNALQEVAYTIADACEYVKYAKAKGLDVDEFAPRISFFFSAQMKFLEEIAKFRSARRIWAKLMKEKFKAKDPKSMMMRFHTQTAGSSLISQVPENNITRTAIEALSAVFGGTQSLHTNSYDEAHSIPSQTAVDIALKTQQIIAYETDVASTIDPFAGSYYIESLTDQLEEEINKELKKIDKQGGMVKSIENGYIKQQIENSAYEKYKQISSSEEIIVGLNKYQSNIDQTQNLEISKYDTQDQEIQKLKKFKQNRKTEKTNKSLKTLEVKAKENKENLMPFVIDAVENYATIGEITKVLKKVYGEYQS